MLGFMDDLAEELSCDMSFFGSPVVEPTWEPSELTNSPSSFLELTEVWGDREKVWAVGFGSSPD